MKARWCNIIIIWCLIIMIIIRTFIVNCGKKGDKYDGKKIKNDKNYKDKDCGVKVVAIEKLKFKKVPVVYPEPKKALKVKSIIKKRGKSRPNWEEPVKIQEYWKEDWNDDLIKIWNSEWKNDWDEWKKDWIEEIEYGDYYNDDYYYDNSYSYDQGWKTKEDAAASWK